MGLKDIPMPFPLGEGEGEDGGEVWDWDEHVNYDYVVIWGKRYVYSMEPYD